MANIKNKQDYKIEMIQIDLLQQNPLNSKIHTEEQIDQIARSIQDFGFNDPIETDENLMVLVGHGRIEAARLLGMEQVPVVKHTHMTDKEKEAYTIINNKTTLSTGLDYKLTDMVIESVGFDSFEGYGLDKFRPYETATDELEQAAPGNYNTAPLPFQGQKRNSIEKFREVISENFDDSYTFVDLFGGSGLLSVNIKRIFPSARVVYNDFDNYRERCENIEETNKLSNELNNIVKHVESKTRINPKTQNKINQLFEDAEKEKRYIDYKTLSTQILFSGNYLDSFEELLKQTSLYARQRKNNYNVEYVKNFHDGLEIRRQDYQELIQEFENDKVVFIADPPYLSTDITTYEGGKYWGLKDYLDINSMLSDKNFIFFTSERSALMQLDEWLKENTKIELFDKNAEVHTNQVNINKGAGYTDIMVVSIKGN